MEQTSSSELEVFFLPSPSTSAQDQSERSINPLEGWEAGWAAVEKDLEGLKMRAGSDERKGEPNRECERHCRSCTDLGRGIIGLTYCFALCSSIDAVFGRC